MVGSTWNERISGSRTRSLALNGGPIAPGLIPQNGEIGIPNVGTVGIGILPSTPTRNPLKAAFVLAGLQPLPPTPVILHGGALTLSVWAKATPSVGMITLCTVFWRSKTRL